MGVDDRLTLREIDRMYPDEWVLLADFADSDRPRRRARVVFHSRDQVAVLARAREWEWPEQSVRFTGGIDQSVVYAL